MRKCDAALWTPKGPHSSMAETNDMIPLPKWGRGWHAALKLVFVGQYYPGRYGPVRKSGRGQLQQLTQIT